MGPASPNESRRGRCARRAAASFRRVGLALTIAASLAGCGGDEVIAFSGHGRSRDGGTREAGVIFFDAGQLQRFDAGPTEDTSDLACYPIRVTFSPGSGNTVPWTLGTFEVCDFFGFTIAPDERAEAEILIGHECWATECMTRRPFGHIVAKSDYETLFCPVEATLGIREWFCLIGE